MLPRHSGRHSGYGISRSSLALENAVIHPYALQIHPSNNANQDLRVDGGLRDGQTS